MNSVRRSGMKLCNLRNKWLYVLPKAFSTEGKKLVDVKVNEKTGVATVTLQRPPVNGLNLELLTEISATLGDLTKAKSRGMILTSASPSVFSAGLDIMELYKPNKERIREFWTMLQEMWLRLYGAEYPTVAAITGHAPAGGCLMSLSCEYRVMAANFTIGLNETQLGLIAPSWFRDSMLAVIGTRQTELALTSGRMFTTEDALKIGLIDEVAANREEVMVKAEQFIARYKRIPPLARNITKQDIRSGIIQGLASRREEDVTQFLSLINRPDVQKGLGLYLQSLKK